MKYLKQLLYLVEEDFDKCIHVYIWTEIILRTFAGDEATNGCCEQIRQGSQLFRGRSCFQNAFTVPGEMIASVAFQAFATALFRRAFNNVQVSNVAVNEIAIFFPQN